MRRGEREAILLLSKLENIHSPYTTGVVSLGIPDSENKKTANLKHISSKHEKGLFRLTKLQLRE